MAYFKVTASELRKKAGELRTANGRFKSQIGNLESQEGTLNNQWEGDANQAFHNAFLTDKGKWDEFYSLIDKYCAALEQMAVQYDKAEATNTDTATKRTY